MIRIQQLKVPLTYDETFLRKEIAKKLRIPVSDIKDLHIRKQSLDARKKPDLYYVLTVDLTVAKEGTILKKKQNIAVSAVTEQSYQMPESESANEKDMTPPGGMTQDGRNMTPPDGMTQDGENMTPPDGMAQDGGNMTPPDGMAQDGGNMTLQEGMSRDGRDMPSGDFQKGGRSEVQNDTKTVYLPVPVVVHTDTDERRTFSILEAGDRLQVTIVTDEEGNETITEIWMLGE